MNRLFLHATWSGALAGLVGAAQPAPGPAARGRALTPSPIYLVRDAPAVGPTLATREEIEARHWKLPTDQPVFHAIVSPDWPEGLAPVFAVEKGGHQELRRRPRPGHENVSEPLFFAFPLPSEIEAGKIVGRWECTATRAGGTEDYFHWELAAEGATLAGRFDQNTDYRFAYVTGGSFQSNRVALHVEYTRNRYVVEGVWHEGTMTGRWRHTEEADVGTWKAVRESPAARVEARGFDAVALYEWRQSGTEARRYAVEANSPGPGWERALEPLCRVWIEQRE